MDYRTLTQEEKNEELEKERIAEKEIDYTEIYRDIENVMKKIENLRRKRYKELKETCSVDKYYTQKWLAEKAGISLSTYKNYLYGDSIDISLRTMLKIANLLRCDLQDILP